MNGMGFMSSILNDKLMNMDTERIIGIVGGVGPFAGLDINRKIFENTKAITDQDHLEVYLLSCSRYITDRTEYLHNQDSIENPANAIFNVICKLNQIGAEIVGIPCNTAHSSLIFNRILSLISNAELNVELVSMIEETKKIIEENPNKLKSIGLLSTLGTYGSGIYQSAFASNAEIKLVLPCDEDRAKVHRAIYDKEFGIKAFSFPVSERAVELLHEVIHVLQKKERVQAIIMGCTEIPLALQQSNINIPLIDPTEILARALIRKSNPSKLS